MTTTNFTSGTVIASAWLNDVDDSVYRKLANYIDATDPVYGAVGNDSTDDTAAIQAAIDAAFSSNISSVFITKYHRISGTVTIKSGVTVHSNTLTSEYYPGDPFNTSTSPGFHKHSTDIAGPIFILESGAAIENCYIKHDKTGGATTGIVQLGTTTTSCYQAIVKGNRIYGHEIDSGGLYTNSSCVGVHLPDGDLGSSYLHYFNRVDQNYVTNCKIAFSLGAECNSNNFQGNTTRQCYIAYSLDGTGSGCVDNVFSGINCANMGTLPTAASTVFQLTNNASYNAFDGTTECNGSAFSVDSTCVFNRFDVLTNELTPSYVPSPDPETAYYGNQDSNYAAPVNNAGFSRKKLIDPSRTNDRYEQIRGDKAEWFKNIAGTMPTCNGGAYPQALVASDTDSKVILRFTPTAYSVAAHTTLRAKLRVYVSQPGNAGTSWAQSEFIIRPTSTSSAASSLTVISAAVQGAGIAGLHFIHGKTGSTGFGIGLVCGGGSGSAANWIAVGLELEALTYDAQVNAHAEYANMSWTTAATTANDVTDAISLLTAATTAI